MVAAARLEVEDEGDLASERWGTRKEGSRGVLVFCPCDFCFFGNFSSFSSWGMTTSESLSAPLTHWAYVLTCRPGPGLHAWLSALGHRTRSPFPGFQHSPGRRL